VAIGLMVFSQIRVLNAVRTDRARAGLVERVAAAARFYLARPVARSGGVLVSRDPYYPPRVEDHRHSVNQSLDRLVQLHRLSAAQARAARTAADEGNKQVVQRGRVMVADQAGWMQAIAMVGRDGQADKFIDPAESALDGLIEKKVQESRLY